MDGLGLLDAPIRMEVAGGRIIPIEGGSAARRLRRLIESSDDGAANAADLNLTLSLAEQYGKENVTFVAVNPGPVRTERWDTLLKARAWDRGITVEDADPLAKASIPLGRICTPEEVADLATFLASDRAHFINGTMINIDGAQRKAIMDIYKWSRCVFNAFQQKEEGS